jgi:hypothetical protein
MKKWQFPLLFVVIVAAVAIGINFGTLYDAAMLRITGDCKYWHASGATDVLDADDRRNMSNEELGCALRSYTKAMKLRNDAY